MVKHLLAAALISIPAVVYSQQQRQQQEQPLCGPTEEVATVLQQEYNESIVWVGKEESGVIVSVWQNTSAGTFTIIRSSRTSKRSCVVSHGKLFPNT